MADQGFDITTEVHGTRAVVAVTGELDLFTAPEFKRVLRDLDHEGVSDMTVDLTAATLLDSAGIAGLFGAYRRIRARGGRLTIHAEDPAITEPLELTGLTDFVSLVA
jgi:anti-sigma B factor antagonist